jgi:hypothetical protein
MMTDTQRALLQNETSGRRVQSVRLVLMGGRG